MIGRRDHGLSTEIDVKLAPQDLDRFLKKFASCVENGEVLAAQTDKAAIPAKNLASSG